MCKLHCITSITPNNLTITLLLVATEQRPSELGLACLAQGHNSVVIPFRPYPSGPPMPDALSANLDCLG